MTAILPRRLRVHPCLGRRNLLAFLCLYQRKQPPNLPVCDQSASAPMNRNTLGLIVVGSGTLFVVSQELLLSPVTQGAESLNSLPAFCDCNRTKCEEKLGHTTRRARLLIDHTDFLLL